MKTSFFHSALCFITSERKGYSQCMARKELKEVLKVEMSVNCVENGAIHRLSSWLRELEKTAVKSPKVLGFLKALFEECDSEL